MIDFFVIKLILSFFSGAIWITTTTYLAERFGPKIGGIITGIPSTIVLSLFFIGWTQSIESSMEATTISPAMMGLADLFTAAYILLAQHPLVISSVGALMIWFLFSYLLVVSPFHSFVSSLVIFAVLFFLSYILIHPRKKVAVQPMKKLVFTYKHIITRAFISGALIAFAVVITKFGSPLLGGVFASFPAVMLSTILIIQPAQGRNFTIELLSTLMISASVNVLIYIFALRFFYPYFGLLGGTFGAFTLALGSSYLTYWWRTGRK